MKLDIIAQNIRDASEELKRIAFDNNNLMISRISGFTLEEAEIMRFFTETEYEELSESEKEKYKEKEEVRELIVKKYNLFDRTTKATSKFAGEQ